MSAKTDNTFEKKMARLQEIVAALESGDLPLEKGMACIRKERRVRAIAASSSTKPGMSLKSGRMVRLVPLSHALWRQAG